MWHHMMIINLVMYGASLHMLYDQVHDAIQDTVHAAIQKFVDIPTHMLNIMLEQKAIISEAEYAYGWCPGDMDLYVPNHEQHDNMLPLITYLIEYDGY